jgi:hypothetical protein
MPFAVRNTEAGPAVFSDLTKNIQIEWAGAGDEDGNDIQQVPDELAEHVNFLRAVQKGIFVVEEAPEAVQTALARQSSAWKRKRDQDATATQEAISQDANNDLVTVPCIGPGRGGGQCGDAVVVKEKTRGDRPPLCERHKGLAGEYVMTETDQILNGRAVKQWSRAGMAPREHQQV